MHELLFFHHQNFNRNRRNKTTRKSKKKFSSLDEDFSFGVDGANVFQDFYGGRHRFRSCQKRMLRVNFKDLNWQVRVSLGTDRGLYSRASSSSAK